MFEFIFFVLIFIVIAVEIFFFIILIQNPAAISALTLKFLFWNVKGEALFWYFLVVSISFIFFIVFVFVNMSTAKRKIEELKAKLYDTVEKKSEELVQEMRVEIGRLREEIETLKKSKPNKKPNE